MTFPATQYGVYGSVWYWLTYWTIDPNLKYKQRDYFLVNNELGIAEGAD